MFIGFLAFRQLEECIVCYYVLYATFVLQYILSCQRVIGDGVFLLDICEFEPPPGTFASMVGHYSKLAKRTPIGSLGAVSNA